MKILLLLFFTFSGLLGFTQNDIPLYNNVGYATYYLDPTSNVVFSYPGDPVAYINTNAGESYSVYDFNGHHLGWYENGIIRDHVGKIVAFRKGAVTNVNLMVFPNKGYRKPIPYKNLHEFDPLKPFETNEFSSTDLMAFFDGSNTTYSQPIEAKKASSNQYNNTSSGSFVPTPLFKPNFKALEEAAIAGQARYNNEQARINNLIANGYGYDSQTNLYYPPEEWEKIKTERLERVSKVQALYYKKNTSRPSKHPKNGRYTAFYMTEGAKYPITNVGFVKIRNNKLKSMEFTGGKRTFRKASKISDWTCTAKIHDNYGFFRDKIEYESCIFYIF